MNFVLLILGAVIMLGFKYLDQGIDKNDVAAGILNVLIGVVLILANVIPFGEYGYPLLQPAIIGFMGQEIWIRIIRVLDKGTKTNKGINR